MSDDEHALAGVEATALAQARANLDREEVRVRLAEVGVDTASYAGTLADLLGPDNPKSIRVRTAELVAKVAGLIGGGGAQDRGAARGNTTLHASVGLNPDMHRLADFAMRLTPSQRRELFDILQAGAGTANGVDIPCEVSGGPPTADD